MITKQEYAARRKQLLSQLGKGAIAIIPAASEYVRNGDSHYYYRQNSDFYYLTGFEEPEAVAVFVPGRAQGEYILFNRERDPEMEVWVGPRAGQKGACDDFGADQAFSIHKLDEELPKLLENQARVYYPISRDRDFNQRILSWIAQVQAKVRSGINAPSELYNIEKIVHEMRLRKSQAEIAVMRKAGEISAAAHCRAMQVCKPGMMEYELQAEIEAHFLKNGCRSVAYNSIVGAGNNACVLHYIDNNAPVKDGDLVLIDAGAEYQYYAADITRTFPANGRFTAEQRAVYEVVLAAQLAVIESVRPGLPWNQLHELSERKIAQGLIDLGLLKGKLDDVLAQQTFKRFYMHRAGHWLGLDVHDMGAYKINGEWRKLEPGMVFTVEPGIYIPAHSEGVDKKWWEIGIRIEDDILVTENGYEVLTAGVPKSVTDIEAMMAAKK